MCCVAAWGENIDEFEDALVRRQRQKGLSDGVAVWICTLSQVVICGSQLTICDDPCVHHSIKLNGTRM